MNSQTHDYSNTTTETARCLFKYIAVYLISAILMMPPGSRSPSEANPLTGKIVVEGIPRRPITCNDVQKWLGKYGCIEEILVYKERIIAQFASDLEAAGVVQCENGANFFGTHVTVKHAELTTLNAMRRSGPPVDRFRNHQPPSDNGREAARGTSNERERDRTRDRDRDRGRDRDRAITSQDRRSDRDREDDRRRYRDTQSPRRRSRSPNLARPDRRHVHPLNWLSEVAGTDKLGSSDSNRQPPPPYTVAIVAVQHDLVPYAETIEKRISLGLRAPEPVADGTLPVRTHIVVLLSLDHLTPCLNDLTRDRVPFAIICTTTNWNHGSCTVRILYVPTQQEHRNMPLDDALILLQREYEMYLTSTATNNSSSFGAIGNNVAAQPLPAPTTPIERNQSTRPSGGGAAAGPVDNDDDVDSFIPPSRHVSTLLRMLADARVLSIGELDEIVAFVDERKRRLEGHKRGADTKDLKLRILNMLYPQSTGTANHSDPAGAGAINGQPPAQQLMTGSAYPGMLTGMSSTSSLPNASALPVLMPPPSAPLSGAASVNAGGRQQLGTTANPNKLAENLTNPAVRHALDTLMNLPTSSLTQMSGGSTSVGMAQSNQQQYNITPSSNPVGRGYPGNKPFGRGGQGRMMPQGNGPSLEPSRYSGGRGGHFGSMSRMRDDGGMPPPHQKDPEIHSRDPEGGNSSNRYYNTYRQSPQQSRASIGGGPPGGQPVEGYRQREMDMYSEETSPEESMTDGRGGWAPRRNRGKRGAILGSRPMGGGSGNYPNQSSYRQSSFSGQSQKGYQSRGNGASGSQPSDLMSAEISPVGSVADAYRADAMGGFLPSYGATYNNSNTYSGSDECYY